MDTNPDVRFWRAPDEDGHLHVLVAPAKSPDAGLVVGEGTCELDRQIEEKDEMRQLLALVDEQYPHNVTRLLRAVGDRDIVAVARMLEGREEAPQGCHPRGRGTEGANFHAR